MYYSFTLSWPNSELVDLPKVVSHGYICQTFFFFFFWGTQLHNFTLTTKRFCLVSKLFSGQTNLFLYNRINDRTASTNPVCWPKQVTGLQRCACHENKLAGDVQNTAVKWQDGITHTVSLKAPKLWTSYFSTQDKAL